MSRTDARFSQADIYLAYRKAKAEAFYENTHFHALAFAKFERNLERNLGKLHSVLNDSENNWFNTSKFIGSYAYLPKSLAPSRHAEDPVFFRHLDPVQEWKRQWRANKKKRLSASFRLVIKPTVSFQVVSALWLLKVGHKFDACLDSRYAFANRIRRFRGDGDSISSDTVGEVNTDCVGLFPPYFSAYRNWRQKGLDSMRSVLEDGGKVLAVTMDLARYYHNVSPAFLLKPKYLSYLDLSLSSSERLFTQELLCAIETWYQSTPDHKERQEGALPVGLSASKVIANVLLVELDRRMVSKIQPVYYGRYVDDIFLVVKPEKRFEGGLQVMRWLNNSLKPIAKIGTDGADGSPDLRITLPYARDSELLFTGTKQKIFSLEGNHGLDLISQIEHQIRAQSSEYRLLPLLPSSTEEMASRALLAQPEAALEADALRKADAVSVRRQGFSILLRNVECYARELRSSMWKQQRESFYSLVYRHVVTPTGVFEYFGYINRVFGVLVASGDFVRALELLERLDTVFDVLEETTSAGTKAKLQLELCKEHFARGLLQVLIQATTVVRFPWLRKKAELLQLLRAINGMSDSVSTTRSLPVLRRLSKELLFADLGRRPYRALWLGRGRHVVKSPPVPNGTEIRRLLRLGAIRKFRKAAGLKTPHWPAVAFPTRPVTLSEVTKAAPELLGQPSQLRDAVFALRGARTRPDDQVRMTYPLDQVAAPELEVYSGESAKRTVAVVSLLTTQEEFEAALKKRPKLSVARYERIRRLINNILRDSPELDYIIFPECSLPSLWAGGIAFTLAMRGISLIAGLEYMVTPKGVRNDALVSLATRWPWYRTSVIYHQPKFQPAHGEKAALYKHGRMKLYVPPNTKAPVYVHGGFCFGVLICSDLTNIQHRFDAQGEIDALFVVEWNRDIRSFSSLVEAAAQDLHAYIVQVNNREYGDSRIRAPKREEYERDVIRVRGGERDYFVVASIDFEELRDFQRAPKSNGPFKPLPIGYRMSERRKSGL